MGAVKPWMIALALALLTGGCSPAPQEPPKVVVGKVAVRAAITTYHPSVGTKCQPAKEYGDVDSVTINGGQSKVSAPLRDGTVLYPSEDKPGGQWCEMRFTAEVAPGSSRYLVGVPGRGDISMGAEDLFSYGVGLVVSADGVDGGRL